MVVDIILVLALVILTAELFFLKKELSSLRDICTKIIIRLDNKKESRSLEKTPSETTGEKPFRKRKRFKKKPSTI